MTSKGMTKFALGAAAAAVVGGALLAFGLAGRDAAVTFWAAAGFAAMVVPGLGCGIWLAYEHGRPGSRFVAAIGTGFVLRLVLAGACAFGAARAGGSAGVGLLSGLAAGFLPVMLFEMVWFASRMRTRVQPEARG